MLKLLSKVSGGTKAVWLAYLVKLPRHDRLVPGTAVEVAGAHGKAPHVPRVPHQRRAQMELRDGSIPLPPPPVLLTDGQTGRGQDKQEAFIIKIKTPGTCVIYGRNERERPRVGGVSIGSMNCALSEKGWAAE